MMSAWCTIVSSCLVCLPMPISHPHTLKTLEYLQRLDSYGVAWKSFTEQYLDSTGMFRDAVIAILATIAKQEHARLSERVVAGLRRAKRQGKVLGRKRIILDRDKIRTMHASGQSVRAILAFPRSTAKVVKDEKRCFV